MNRTHTRTHLPSPLAAGRRQPLAGLVALWALLALGAALPAAAGWSVQLQTLFLEVGGHDQHALTVRQGGGEQRLAATTDGGTAFGSRLAWERGRWTWIIDHFWFITGQTLSVPSAAGSAGSPAEFEVAGRTFVSDDSGETLYYRLLEDNDVAMWTADLYARRTLSERPGRKTFVLFGLRLADFDNDYRAAVGIEGVAGRRLDSSSNYGLMPGPLVGVAAEWQRGKHRLEGTVKQAVVFGDAELTARTRDFVGPFGEMPAFTDEVVFRTTRNVEIPITDLRLDYGYAFGPRFTVGLGATASVWHGVPVPPGVIPTLGPGGQDENSLELVGVVASVRLDF